ncbi:MAG: BMP family ABC transporter substrate-binding protein [Thermoanaerobacteraceae bacterium]|nr:BMP family ABC transporter substrate-binding protein [Thermoanaerobacteraceae bacterium]
MKRIFAVFLTVFMVLTLVACNNNEPASQQETADDSPYADVKIALVSQTIGTEQFILQAYNAFMEAAEKYGFQAISIECSDTADWSEKTRAACVEGYDLIIGIGWYAAEPFSALADEFPDTEFAVIDTIASNERIKSIAFNTADGCYVYGVMVATAFPDEDLFGCVNNFQQQSNYEYRYGFMEGVKSVNPDAEFIHNFTNSYDDTSIAYELAIQQQAAGCKFIFGNVSSSANHGIYQACLDLATKGTPIYTSGLSVDQTTPDNPYILGGLTKNTGVCTTLIIEDFLNGNYEGGAQILGFKEGAFGVVNISPEGANYWNDEIMNEEVMAAGRAAADAIRSGKIVIEVPLEK